MNETFSSYLFDLLETLFPGECGESAHSIESDSQIVFFGLQLTRCGFLGEYFKSTIYKL